MNGGERRTVSAWIADVFQRNHENALAAVAELDDDALRWRPARSNSVGFNLWHLARWADRMQSQLRRGAEIWEREALASTWGFPPELGTHDTGMELEDALAAQLPLPAKDRLVGYASRSFAALQEALQAVDDEALLRPAAAASHLTTGQWLLNQVRHEARHLGMVEALKGAQGVRGTATV